MCRTWFRVSREQLRAAHGLVRCSRCGTVFNALATLRDRVPAEAAATEDEPHAEAEPDRETEDGDESPKGGAETEPAGEVPPILREVPARPPRRWPWTLALVLAALVLAGELVNGARAPLLASPVTGPPLATLYRAFGANPAPRVTLSRYAIAHASLDALARENGALLLHGKLRNRAAHAQPFPLVSVTLTDRFGKAVGARIIAPAEYGAQAGKTLGAHGTFRFHVKLADPGVRAVGFSLTLCKRRNGRVLCQSS